MNDKVPDTSNWKSSEVGGMCFSNGLQIQVKFYINYQLQKNAGLQIQRSGVLQLLLVLVTNPSQVLYQLSVTKKRRIANPTKRGD
jgi:hypothetical protein